MKGKPVSYTHLRVKAQLRRFKKYSPGIITEKVPSELSYNKLCLNVQTHECLLYLGVGIIYF